MLIAIALGALLFVGPVTAYAADIYVSDDAASGGLGTIDSPYKFIARAVELARILPGSTIWIEDGVYPELYTIDFPCTLRLWGGGRACLGGECTPPPPPSSTTLDILTLNTCLFGDSPGVHWQDDQRARDIGEFLGGSPKPDVVGLQEIWDQDLFWDSWRLFLSSGYPYGAYGGDTDCTESTFLNSGLALMSLHDFDYHQHCWPDCAGFQCYASKGFLRATIEKDGFAITVFNVHTQAFRKQEDIDARLAQITYLGDYVDTWRHDPRFRHHVVFVIGDFNIIGESEEYLTLAANLFAGLDAFKGGQATYSKQNPLAEYFAAELAILYPEDYPFPPDDQRLDYIWYFGSGDGSVGVTPRNVKVVPFRGSDLTEDELTTNEKSDHWALHGQFYLFR